MPDSQLPTLGPAPYDERDLDNLLSGNLGYVPDALRPVARTLAALRAVPTDAELAGEAAARAEFRKYMPAGSWPGWTAGDAAHTRVLASPQPLPPSKRPPRHRRPSRRANWRVIGGLSAAAAVIIVVVAALGGAFSGSAGGSGGLASNPPSATSTGSASGSVRQGVEGRATSAPSAHPTPTASGAQPATGQDVTALCREYFASFGHPWTQNALVQQLSEPAGGSWNVENYCYTKLSDSGDYLGDPWSPRQDGNVPAQQGPGGGQGAPGQNQGGPGQNQGGPGQNQGGPGQNQGGQNGNQGGQNGNQGGHGN